MNAQNEIRVMLVGDFLIFRNGLKLLLETEKKIRVVGEAADLSEVSDLISKLRPNMLLIDSAAADSDVFSQFVAAQSEHISIIVITGSKEIEGHRRYLMHGINGIISKAENATALFKAIDSVNRGEMWFVRKLLDETIKQLIGSKKTIDKAVFSSNCAILTERERKILTLICQGMKNKTIADKLFISETTVRHHLTSIFEKLKVGSRLELVVYAFKEKLVEIPVEDLGFSSKFVSS